MVVGFITTVSSNPAHGDVYSIQHYVIKLVSDLRHVGGFLQFPPPVKLAATYTYTISSPHPLPPVYAIYAANSVIYIFLFELTIVSACAFYFANMLVNLLYNM